MPGIIIINTDNIPVICDNKCNNTECSKHLSSLSKRKGGCKIKKLKDTEKCEGYIPRKKVIPEDIVYHIKTGE